MIKTLSLICVIMSFSVGVTESLKVMSQNIWYKDAEHNRIASIIKDADADVVGMQEVNNEADAKGVVDELNKITPFVWSYIHDSDIAVLTRHHIIQTASATPAGGSTVVYGAKVRTNSGSEFWCFNVHLSHHPYGPYQLNGLEYMGGAYYDPLNLTPANIDSVIADQNGARQAEAQAVADVIASKVSAGDTVLLTGDFNEPSHLDWTAAVKNAWTADSANNPQLAGRTAVVEWPTSQRFIAAGLKDSYREKYPDPVAKPGITWSPTDVTNSGYNYQAYQTTGSSAPYTGPEPFDRIDFIYVANAVIDAAQIIGATGDTVADIQSSNFGASPATGLDHRGLLTTFTVSPKSTDMTRLTFDGTGSNNSVLPSTYGSNASATATGIEVTGSGTPNVALDWKAPASVSGSASTFNGWQVYDWTFSKGQSMSTQVDFSGNGANTAANDSYLEVKLIPQQGYKVDLYSFDVGTWNGYGNFGLKWSVYTTDATKPVKFGEATVYDNAANGATYLTINSYISSADALTIRLMPTATTGFDNFALDNLVFGQQTIPKINGSTTLTFAGADNVALGQTFGSNITASGSGYTVTGDGTPDVSVEWSKGSVSGNASGLKGWESYNWTFSNGASLAAQADFSSGTASDSYLEAKLNVAGKYTVKLDSFDIGIWPGYPCNVSWSVYSTDAASPLANGTVDLTDANGYVTVDVNKQVSGASLTLRLIQNSGDKTGLAIDNLKFSQSGPGLSPAFGVQVNLNGDVLNWHVEKEFDVAVYEVQQLQGEKWVTVKTVNAEDRQDYSVAVDNVKASYRIVVVDNSGYRQAFQPQETQTYLNLPVKAGWNLLSVPFPEACEVELLNGKAWLWNGNNYYQSSPEIGAGFWFYSEVSGALYLSGRQAEISEMDLQVGWNLIGTVDDVELSTDHTIYTYDKVYNQLQQDEKLLFKGQGYWIYSHEAVRLAL